MEVRFLSFELGNDTPTFGDNPPVSFQPVSLIENGGIANYFELKTINHNGTHVEAPWHFNPGGARLTDFKPEDFVFVRPVLIDVVKTDNELITDLDLMPHAARLEQADLLLLRTGYGALYRLADPKRYGRRAPGFDASAGRYLLQFPELRGIVMDIPSAGAYAHPETGYEFHRVVMGLGDPDHTMFIVEDARLDSDLRQTDLSRIIIAPLLLKAADAAPATLIAE
jgi:kynurenine formamidase